MRMYGLIFILVWIAARTPAVPVTLPLDEINAALAAGVSNATSRSRVDAVAAWSGGLETVGFGLGRVNAALAMAEALVGLDGLDAVMAWSGGLETVGFGLGRVNAALADAEGLVGIEGRIRRMEGRVGVVSVCGFQQVELLDWVNELRPWWRGDTYDLSSFVGTGGSLVALEIVGTGYSTAWPLDVRVYSAIPGVPSSRGGVSLLSIRDSVATRSGMMFAATDSLGRINISIYSNYSNRIIIRLVAWVTRAPTYLPAWWVSSGLPIYFDGVGWVSAAGGAVDGHVLPEIDATYAAPAAPSTGDYAFDAAQGIAVWFDGVGWINAAGAPVDGHTKPAVDGGYTRPASPADNDVEYDAALRLPIFGWSGGWINASGAEI